MSRLAPTTAAALILAGCAGADVSPAPAPAAPSPPASAAAPSPVPLPTAQAAPPRIVLPAAPISVAPPPKPDQCGAYLLGNLVGRPRTEIPVPVDPSRRRVVCTTCPRTQDLRPDRLTIEYDAGTGKVTRLGCN